jgi:hypothetical protein
VENLGKRSSSGGVAGLSRKRGYVERDLKAALQEWMIHQRVFVPVPAAAKKEVMNWDPPRRPLAKRTSGP